MDWSPQQDAALKTVSRWLKSGSPQVFRMFGFAGTGKTTLARQIAEDADGPVCFAAFTGKAASAMRSRGCENASTIHSLIYTPRESDANSMSPEFVLNWNSDLVDADLVIIDECSMVDELLGRDLLKFEVPVLVLGDPAQLPPVSGGGFFTDCEPDVMLTEVHRQAADNPIISMSMEIRNGGKLSYGPYGDSRVIRRTEIDSDSILAANQILVGRNKTRGQFNRRIRELKGFEDTTPVNGEKLVCLRNDRMRGLLNGGIWEVTRIRKKRRNKLNFDVASEETRHRSITVSVLPEFFEGKADQLSYQARRSSDEFDFGYALTVHKAQGSQWDEVVLFDESGSFREHSNRWLYTGITRAAERITVVK